MSISPQISLSSSMSSHRKTRCGRAFAIRSKVTRNSLQESHQAAQSATTSVVVPAAKYASSAPRSLAVSMKKGHAPGREDDGPTQRYTKLQPGTDGGIQAVDRLGRVAPGASTCTQA